MPPIGRQTIPCPQCGQAVDLEIWQVLDLGREPDLRRRFLAGEINLARCPHCETISITDTSFVVNDPTCRRLIFFVPQELDANTRRQDIQILHNILPLVFGAPPDYFTSPVVVGDWDELLGLLAEGQESDSEAEASLATALAEFFAAAGWQKKQQFVARHHELLSEAAQVLLTEYWEQADRKGDETLRREISWGLLLLIRCTAVGAAAAFAEFAGVLPATVSDDGEMIFTVDIPALMNIYLGNGPMVEAVNRHPEQIQFWVDFLHTLNDKAAVDQDVDLWNATCLGLGIAYRALPGFERRQNLSSAIQYLDVAVQAYPEEELAVVYATAQNELGLVYLDLPSGDQLENLSRAIACFRAALRCRKPDMEPLDYAATVNNLGMALTRRQDQDTEAHLREAVTHFEEALRYFTREARPTEYAKVNNNLGTAYFDLGEVDVEYLQKAIACYEAALSIWADEGISHLQASVLINLGRAYAAQPDGDREQNLRQAIRHFEHALAILDTEAFPREYGAAAEALGSAYLSLDPAHFNHAVRCYKSALAALAPDAFPNDVRRIARALGDIYLERGAWAEAEAAYRQTVAAHEVLYEVAATDQSRWQEIGQALGLFTNLAYVLARLGRYEEAVIQIEVGRTRVLTEVLIRDHAQLAQLDEQTRRAFIEARDRVRALEIDGFKPGSDVVVVSEELRRARAVLHELIERIRSEHPEFMSPTLTFSEITAVGPLAYVTATTRGSLVLIVPPGVSRLTAQHALWIDDFTAEMLGALLVSYTEEGEIGGGYLIVQRHPEFDTLWKLTLQSVLEQFGAAVVKPLIQCLRRLKLGRITLIPTGLFSVLPFHAALYRGPGEAQHAALQSLEISYAPSARALVVARQLAARVKNRPASLLAVGNPATDPGIGLPLPFAAAEVQAIAPFFIEGKPRILLGEGATLQAVRDALPAATVLHLACHGRWDPLDALASGVMLSRSDRLTLTDLLSTLSLEGIRLVVLSACQTGISDVGELREEALGLPAGFLQAGVPGVVSTLWAVDDLSTMLLMERFYQYHLKDGMASAAALRQAQLWLKDVTAGELAVRFTGEREAIMSRTRLSAETVSVQFRRFATLDPNECPFAHPFYWAAFTFSGA